MEFAVILAVLAGHAHAEIFAGTGGYSALMVTYAAPTPLVQRLLPAGLSLAPQNFSAPGTHPMVFAFGNQTGVHPKAPFPKLFNWTYLEFINHPVRAAVRARSDERRLVEHRMPRALPL